MDNDGVLGGTRIRLKKESDVSWAGHPDVLLANVVDSGGTGHSVEIANTSYRWSPAEWVHLAMEWDSTAAADNVRVYLNGVKLVPVAASNGTFTMPAESTSGLLRIGNSTINTVFNADGIIDEFTVYDSPTTPTALAHGGLTSSANEYLADGARNYTLAFAGVNAVRQGPYAYFGSDSKWSGLNVAFQSAGVGAGRSTSSGSSGTARPGSPWNRVTVSPTRRTPDDERHHLLDGRPGRLEALLRERRARSLLRARVPHGRERRVLHGSDRDADPDGHPALPVLQRRDCGERRSSASACRCRRRSA